MTTPIDVLVLNAGLRQSLVTVRSLGRRGLAVAAVDTVADVPAFRSRRCRSHSAFPTGLSVASDMAVPLLNHWFESTVPGLYFVGLTSLRAFGPLYRFVAGCASASRRVARDVARRGLARC